MKQYAFSQLFDIRQIQTLMESYNKVTGLLSAILDTGEKVLVAVGWQDICVRFHRQNPITLARCKESEACIKSRLHEYEGRFFEYRCKNGLWDMAMPIFLDGEHIATFFFGQCFCEDDIPEPEFFRRQAREFGFDEGMYLEALAKVPIYSREQMGNALELYTKLINIITEMGMKKLKLIQEIEARRKVDRRLQESRAYTDKLLNSILDSGSTEL